MEVNAIDVVLVLAILALTYVDSVLLREIFKGR